MADINQAAETVDTAAQNTTTAAAPAAAEAAKDDAKKVELDRLINEEGYVEKVLTEKQAQPSDAAAAEVRVEEPSQEEAAAEPTPPAGQTVIFRDEDGTEERITLEQAQNRLNQAKQLARRWQNEIAPLGKIIRENPALGEALQAAVRGDRTKIDAMLRGGGAADAPDALKAEEERLEKLAEKLQANKDFEGWKKDELKANLKAIKAMKDALEVKPEGAVKDAQTDFQAQAREIGAESQRLQAWLQTADPEYTANREAVKEVIGEMAKLVEQGKVSKQEFDHTLMLYNDPRNKDENGVPLYMKLHAAAREWRRQKAAPAPAAPVAAVKSGVNARITPGAARTGGAAPAGALPSLAGKSREERLALMDSFLGV